MNAMMSKLDSYKWINKMMIEKINEGKKGQMKNKLINGRTNVKMVEKKWMNERINIKLMN